MTQTPSNPVDTILSDTRRTFEQQRQSEQSQSGQKPGFFRAVGDAINSEWTSSFLLRHIERSQYTFDPEFILDKKTAESLATGVDPDLINELGNAISGAQALEIRNQLLTVQHSRERLNQLGWRGFALRIAANVLDPAFIAGGTASTFAAGPAGPISAAGGRLTKLSHLARTGVLFAAPEVALESYLTTQDPDRDVHDILFAGAGAFLLGGAGEWINQARLTRAANRVQRDIELSSAMGAAARNELIGQNMQDLLDQKIITTRKGRMYFKDQIDPERRTQVINDLIEKSGLDAEIDADEIATLRNMSNEEALQVFSREGGHQIKDIEPPDSPLGARDFNPAQTGDERALYSPVRFGMVGRVGASAVSGARKLGNLLMQDLLPKVDAAGKLVPARFAASEWVTRTHSTLMARYYRESLDAFRQWARANNVRAIGAVKARHEFFEQVGRVIRAPRGTYTDPHLNRVADLQRQLQAEILETARRHGVKGFADIPQSDTYLMRFWNAGRINAAVEQFGDETVIDLFESAIIRATPDIDAEGKGLARKIATGYLRGLRKLENITDVQKARLFDRENADLLQSVLKEEVPEITEIELRRIESRLAPRQADANVPDRGLRRLDLDEQTVIPTDAGPLAIEDLLENNAEILFSYYSRQMTGHSAMARVFDAMKDTDEEVIENFGHLRSKLTREAASMGLTKADRKFNKDLERLEIAYRSIMGLRLGSNSAVADALRGMRAFNFIRLSGQYGVSQIPELGNIIGGAGVRAMFQQMPALQKVFTRARTGKLSNELLEEIETIIGVGTDRLNHQVLNRLDTSEAVAEFGGSRATLALERGSRVANDLSMMAPVNIFLQRASAAAGIQKIVNQAMSNRIPSAKRLAVLGLDEADWRVMRDQIRAHVTTERGMLGRNVRRINVDQWADQDAAAKMVGAIDRWSRRAIQQNDIGQLSAWMTTDIGRTILQFRTFITVAWEKQFLHHVAMRDWETFGSVMATSLIAGLAYAAQQQILSVGRPDREEYLNNRLSPENIALAAFQRGGYSSLMPNIIDTASQLTGGGPVFTFRNSGLSTGFSTEQWLGNPTDEVVRSAGAMLAAFGAQARSAIGVGEPDEQITEAEVRAMLRLAPFRNVTGIKNMLDAFEQRFPDSN